MSVPDVTSAARDIAFAFPHLKFGLLWDGLTDMAPLLATAIPLGVYNFTEAMTNVESAATAGDKYNLRSVLLADGGGAVIGSMLGSPFPPAVYVGHPGWKAAGGRTGYSMATGVVIALLCFFGLFGLLGAIFPTAAIVPILLYIGLLIGAQAFQATPRAHAAAVVAALIPNIASWATGQMDNALAAAGTTANEVGIGALAGAGVVYDGLKTLGSGAILAGLVLGAIVAFIIDKRFVHAAIFSLTGAALTFVGLIHAEKVQFNADGQVALGYLLPGRGLRPVRPDQARAPGPGGGRAAVLRGQRLHRGAGGRRSRSSARPHRSESPAARRSRRAALSLEASWRSTDRTSWPRWAPPSPPTSRP